MERKCMLTGFAIVVLDRGFVYVGDVQISDNWCVVSNAKNIRCWGTSRGLGELALNGQDILSGTFIFPELRKRAGKARQGGRG